MRPFLALTYRVRARAPPVPSWSPRRACVTGHGSMFRVHMKATAPKDFRDAYPTPDESKQLKALLAHMFDNGIILINSGSSTLSTPMTETEIDTLVGAFRSGFEKLVAMG